MKIIAPILIVALAAVGWVVWDNRALTRSLSAAEMTITAQASALAGAHRQAALIQAVYGFNESLQAIQQSALYSANQLAATRQKTIMRLLDENKAVRDWYRARLPADVIRLHDRPAFANVNDYLRWLSQSSQLPHTGQLASD